MPKIDMNAYQAATANNGEFERMPAGGYVCAIQAVRTSGTGYGNKTIDYIAEKQYVKLIWDIIEGDYAGRYSDDYWSGEEKDYGHQFYMSWKNLGAFKAVIQALEESNPGFDAMAAFEADNWQLFIGKKIGLVIGEEEYRANDGSIKLRYTLPRAKSVQDIKAGKYRVPKLKKLEDETAVTTPTNDKGEAVNDDDLPF